MAVAVAALVVPAAASAWTWPVAGPVLRGFLFSEDNPLAPGQHRGIDIQGAAGDPVLAPTAGTVTFVGRVAANGLTVTIETRDGYTVTLLHLGSVLVATGAAVAEGQRVAVVDTSGAPEYAAPYVQLGIRLTSDPEGYRDPQGFLPPPASPAVPPQPAPEVDPRPAPALPPTSVTPPAAPAPRPSSDDPAVPQRTPGPVASTPHRPVVRPGSHGIATPGGQPAVSLGSSFVAAPTSSVTATSSPMRTPGQHAVERALSPASPSLQPVAPRMHAASHRPAAPPAVATWVRPLDAFAPSAAPARTGAGHGPTPPPPGLLALLAALAVASCLCAREFGRRAARIIGGDAVLPDDTDLLRELEPAHRARVHDDRRGRGHPAPQAAR